MIELRKHQRKKHPTYDIFKKEEIPLIAVADALGFSYSHMSAVLTGLRKATPDADNKLRLLAESLKNSKKDGGTDIRKFTKQ